MKLATVAAAIALVVVTSAAGPPFSDPPLGSHCTATAASARSTRTAAAARAGARSKADAQPLQRLDALLDVAVHRTAWPGPIPCRDIDLMAFLPHGEIGGGSGNDIWGWTDPLTGREYALVGRSTGTAFVDISNPSQPVYVGNLPTHTVSSTWRGIKVFADHAFIVSEALNHGMQVFDLTQLRDVASPPVTFAETAHYAGFGSTHTLAMNTRTGFAYAAGTRTCEGGLHVVDVRTPAAPRAAGCFSFDGYTHETQCVVYDGPDTLLSRPRDLLQLERRHADDRRCHRQARTGAAVADRIRRQRLHAPGMAHRGSAVLPRQRRRRRAGLQASDSNVDLGRVGPRRAGAREPLRRPDPVDRSQPLYPRQSRLRVELPQRTARARRQRDRAGRAARGRLLRHLSVRRRSRPTTAPGRRIRSSPADRWSSTASSRACSSSGRARRRRACRPASSVTIAGPGSAAPSIRSGRSSSMVATTGPAASRETRVIEMPPATAQLLSARAVAGRVLGRPRSSTCDLGSLAPGSEAFVVVTVRATDEGDFVSTAIASAQLGRRLRNESLGGDDDARRQARTRAHAAAAGERHAVPARAQQHRPVDAARRRRRRQHRSVARRWRDAGRG